MRKLIAIIFMFIIASNSYYGAVNDKGEKVTNVQEILEEQNLIADEIVEEQENSVVEQTEETKEISEILKTENEEKSEITQTDVELQSKEAQEDKTTATKTDTISEVRQETKQEIQEESNKTTKTEVKVQEQGTAKCSDTKHGVEVGNSNKWFNSYSDAISYYDNLINEYSEQVHNEEITIEEYNQNCPYGYEIWSCPYCNKWTLNFYFR